MEVAKSILLSDPLILVLLFEHYMHLFFVYNDILL